MVSKFDNIYHFSCYEFDSPDYQGSGERMELDFLKKLDRARWVAHIPFKITSGFRTIQYNKTLKGAVTDSAHTKGLACDISAVTSSERYKIVSALIQVGFTRIGISRTFIHVDLDNSKPQEVIWLY